MCCCRRSVLRPPCYHSCSSLFRVLTPRHIHQLVSAKRSAVLLRIFPSVRIRHEHAKVAVTVAPSCCKRTCCNSCASAHIPRACFSDSHWLRAIPRMKPDSALGAGCSSSLAQEPLLREGAMTDPLQAGQSQWLYEVELHTLITRSTLVAHTPCAN